MPSTSADSASYLSIRLQDSSCACSSLSGDQLTCILELFIYKPLACKRCHDQNIASRSCVSATNYYKQSKADMVTATWLTNYSHYNHQLIAKKSFAFLIPFCKGVKANPSAKASLKEFCKSVETNPSAKASLREFCKGVETNPSAKASLKEFCKGCFTFNIGCAEDYQIAVPKSFSWILYSPLVNKSSFFHCFLMGGREMSF